MPPSCSLCDPSGDDFTRFNLHAVFRPSRILLSERRANNFQPVNFVAKQKVISVIRQRRSGIDVGNSALGGRHHRVNRFAAFVALQAADVSPRALTAFGADAAKVRSSTVADGATKIFLRRLFERARLRSQLKSFCAKWSDAKG